MKINLYTILIVVFATFVSCEDVIDVEVPTAAPRLVIEASLDWEKGTLGNEQLIKLSMSTAYFDVTSDSGVTGAFVKVTNTNTGEEFLFEDQNDGTYTTSSFVPIENDLYTLEIVHNNETYVGSEILVPVTDISNITQSTDGGLDPDLLELNVYFNDPADEDNYYLLRYYEEGDLFPVLREISDEFSNGNEMYNFYEKRDDEDNNEEPFEVGDTVEISFFGISERYYNYMRLLIEQYATGGDPFSSNSAQLRGNCVNQTNPENYPFGYFRVTEVEKTSYTFE
ncbi:DUF4249 domain-containing protein [Mangrovimonas sp. YM274]|uniref:DUF4249 domain-containing protein n=1 Tax=Mangrovimonas sp. YM274 TaxID=3070660 RepID=UPI0027DDF46E|nr:DUF4249 domain-containing protein [Mangrovimonas sp. YM274]WMI68949.1 DUF4249 domain-containing protein [Mangrovimonas sp. YM274]